MIGLDIDHFHELLIGFRGQIFLAAIKVFDDHMAFQVDIMKMREDDLKILLVDQIIQSIRLPLGHFIPSADHTFFDELCIITAQQTIRRRKAHVFYHILVQRLRMPQTVIMDVQRIGYPELHIRPILRQFQKPQVAVDCQPFIILDGLIQDIDNDLARVKDSERFQVLTGTVDRHPIIFSFFIAEYLAIASDQSFAGQQSERLSASGLDGPFVIDLCDRRKDHIKRLFRQRAFPICVAEQNIHALFGLCLLHKFVMLLSLLHDIQISNDAGDAAVRTGFFPIDQFLCPHAGHCDHIHIGTVAAIDASGLRAIDYMQMRII